MSEAPAAALEAPALELPAPRPDRAVSPFEFLPGWIAYGPVIAQWIALGLRHGDMSLPTAANPAIPTGGLCGEPKTATLDAVQGEARHWIPPYTTVTTGPGAAASAESALADAGIALPVVLKPDIGCNGTGVRLIRDAASLAAAIAAFPPATRLVLQSFVPFPGEAGLFYIRHPDEARGRLTSLTLKYPPTVTGDGRRTLRALIEADPRHGKLRHLYLARLASRLDDIPAAGQREQLVFTGNHCKGSIFRNGTAEITPALTARIDDIARAIPDFHFGRFDVRYTDLAALRRGENFRVIEINGAGSEATHIWDPATRLRDIWGDQLYHYGQLWKIAAAMRRQGAKPCGLRTMARDWLLQLRVMRSYPLND